MKTSYSPLKLIIETVMILPLLVACAQFQQPDNNDPVLNAVMETPPQDIAEGSPQQTEYSVKSLSSGTLLQKTEREEVETE